MKILRPGEPLEPFPPVDQASAEGIVAVGGDLSPRRLVQAYRRGIFPWFSEGQPIIWWSPDPRAVLYPRDLHVSRSLQKTIRRGRFAVRFDTSFREVLLACADTRPSSSGTWITSDMVDAYCRLYHQGLAHSIETWNGGTLVGGLYGVALGGVFFGESMFSRETDASKCALVSLVETLSCWEFDLIDCQVASPHLTRLGAVEIPRARFQGELEIGLQKSGKPGSWMTAFPASRNRTSQPQS